MENVIACMHKFLGKDHLGRDYVFTDDELQLYKLALTHSSNNNPPHHNQRLALIGDSVLRLIIREYLYELHPDWSKGRLTIAVHLGVIFTTFHRLRGIFITKY